ncbi:MAG TPA: hydroxylamine reductase [Polyangiaceae bacterium]|nr:hydroxylamine reductase [Polyangiaceae bacterium]
MFCNQCEQVARGVACTERGVCGKSPDIQSLEEILLYGIKGMAAYAHHARRLGKSDEAVSAFIEEGLFSTVTNVNFDMDAMFELVLKCGEMNLRTMELLDQAHVSTFGSPAITEVYEGTRPGPGILITGHDLLDLKHLLDQTAGTGINVYTHGEMLPAHMYPELRRYPHLAGHFGGAWQKQRQEFAEFTGPIVATTNCILIPPEVYRGRLYTLRATAVPGAKRLQNDDYSEVIASAKSLPSLSEHHVRTSTIGFHHSVLKSVAPNIVEAVQRGLLRRFFVIGGCDGAEIGRNYFADYARLTPKDTLILTVGCGKYRIRNESVGTFDLPGVGAIPRILDMGQCNDSFGAIEVALALAKAFNCGVNELPLNIVLSWFEQKAVAVLLTLLHLGVKGIRIGPNPPAFVSPNVMRILKDKFDLDLVGTDPNADLDIALGVSAKPVATHHLGVVS